MARIALIMGEMFEDSEFRVPYDTLRTEGHQVVIIGTEGGKEIHGKRGRETVRTERSIEEVSAEGFDALVIPGGYSPDHLRTDPDMVAFVRAFIRAGKTVAAICHGPWMLAEADVIRGRTVTSWPSIRTDLMNAGARWVDREVVEDGIIVTSRKPGDLSAFTQTILRRLEAREPAEEAHRRPHAEAAS